MGDMIERLAKERARDFYFSSPQIKTVKLINKETNELIKCQCGNIHYKMYKKWGGPIFGKYNKLIKNNKVRYNFICKCGDRLIITEDKFKYAKAKYGCSAGVCVFGKSKMDRECITCKYIYEK